MRIFTAALTLLFLSAGLVLSSGAPDTETLHLKGKIRKTVVIRHRAIFDKNGEAIAAQVLDSTVTVFNPFGNIVDESDYYGAVLMQRHLFTYLADSQVVRMKRFYRNKPTSGLITDSTIFVWEDGLVRERRYLSEVNSGVILSVYAGRTLQAEFTVSSSGDTIAQSLFTYDADGRLTEERRERRREEGMMPEQSTQYVYDAKDRRAQMSVKRENGELYSSVVYEYNDHDDCVKEVLTRQHSVRTTEYVYEYDVKGNWIRRTAFGSLRDKDVDIREHSPETVEVRKITYAE